MSPLLKNRLQVRMLATELGLAAGEDPVRAILAFCERRIRDVLREFPHCVTPALLLPALANKLGTVFEIVRTDADLRRLKARYVGEGELGFARLEEELDGRTYGITLRRFQRKFWEPEFISVIDCRGEKAHRENYTKWHELGHLLILTDKSRAAFRRTHCSLEDIKDPEESLVDVIAGTFAFFSEMVRPFAHGPVSFELIESIREQLSPQASRQSALIGIVKAWPTPCLLVHAELGLRKNEKRKLQQGSFGFEPQPELSLRAVHVTQSESARQTGFYIFPNMRVPQQSIIHSIFSDGIGQGEAVEDLDWWESSDGARLSPRRVVVKARFAWNSVESLIFPAAD